METRTLATTAAAPVMTWSREEVDTIRRTVAEGASDAELSMFLHLSKSYGLDPFAKDIWFIKAGGKPIIMTSRDGYLKIANRDPHFRGMKADVVYAGDLFERTENGVRHQYNTKDRGTPIGAYAIVKRDDRDIDTYVFVPFRDYNKGGGTWRQYPHAMILKVAEAMALKRAFSISGLVTREEIEEEPERREPNLGEWARKLYGHFLEICGSPEAAKEAMMSVVPKPSKDYTQEDIAALMAELNRLEEAREQTKEPGPAEPTTEGGEIIPEMVEFEEAPEGAA